MGGRWDRLAAILAALIVVLASGAAWGAPPADPSEAARSASPETIDQKASRETANRAAADDLSAEQKRIAGQYKHLEEVLVRMAELNAATDPRRAALLKKAVGQSKEQLISVRLDQLVELLGKDQLSRALENQTEASRDLQSLLQLLLSEDRSKHIESEKARIREYLKQLNRIIKQQKDVQGRTGVDDVKRLAEEQNRLTRRADQLAQELKKNEEGKADKGGEDGGRKAEGQEEKGSPGGPSQGPSPSPDDKNKKQEQQNPTRQRLEAARQRMTEAEAKLKEAQRKGAGEKQEEAIRELERAKVQLEEILRQLREEEIERVLTMLEARFRRMLAMQQEVYEGTVRLDKVPEADRTHNHEIEASRLSGKESQIIVEADKTLLVLHEDGTAAAIPEATEQMRDDMEQVVQRLAQAKVGKVTQNIEEDILAAMQEMIDALKQARKDQENKNKPRRQQGGPSQEPPLVDTLAELKMIRALQMRVNTRTARYSQMITGEQAENAEMVDGLKRLAERQERIHRVTRDLQSGKNQ